ncbi:DUF2339 domain-containing protein [Erythrobacter sp. HKB08]|uniref:DUF2339 domain-containing protein n=1 Tax=Erythrobacter sp. HKB08 TaxID=2502843 RepID=UPI0010087694|nr:DUF2339 domain-containing protein [Erythrobacter sp. HKB08]
MTIFLLFVLGIAVAYLWTRYDAMARDYRALEQRLDAAEWRLGQAQPSTEPQEEPVAEPVEAPRAEAAKRTFVPQMRSRPATPEPHGDERPRVTGSKVPAIKLPSFDFEDIFGRLLPIWAGGVALALAGFFLVRYSIEAGLLGPSVRVILGFLFGTLLLGGAELAYRQEKRIADERVRQALAGAGLATLYASFYMAGSLYGLIGPAVAFLGLAAVTAGAIALSFRFGLPSAILGLVGGFAAPALVASDETNLPLLSLYLALVTGGLSYAGQKQGRSWLGIAALGGGLGWGALILLTDVTGVSDIAAYGLYLVMLGAVIPAFTHGPSVHPAIRLGAAALAAVQMAAMVSLNGHEPLGWGLYLLLGATLVVFAWRDARLREAVAFAAAVAVVMLGLWSDAANGEFLAVMLGIAAVFTLVPLVDIWRGRGRAIDFAQIAGVSAALAAFVDLQFAYEWSLTARAALLAGLAALPAAAAVRPLQEREDKLGWAGNAVIAVAATICAGALLTLLPDWADVFGVAPVATGLAVLASRRDDNLLRTSGWLAIFATLVALGSDWMVGDEFERLVTIQPATFDGYSLLRWAALLPAPLAYALLAKTGRTRTAGEIVGALAVYGLIAQFLPGDALAWATAAIGIGVLFLQRERLAAAATAVALAAAWALIPVGNWLELGLQSLAGNAFLRPVQPDLASVALRILPFAASAAAFGALSNDARLRATGFTAAGAMAAIALHLAYKQLFGIGIPAEFTQLGMAERTVWQVALVGAGWAVWKFASKAEWSRWAASALATTGLAHFALYSLGWHNPAFTAQAVGSLPVLNLLLPAFGAAIAAIILLRDIWSENRIAMKRIADGAIMLLVTLGALGLLRQGFSGTFLIGPPLGTVVGETESLLRSLLGIVLALGFLGWGTRTDSRSWRVGSLVLMLLAVLKVFLFDTAGLEGLLRIASFMALGFSLIGIGWFYTRQLRGSGKGPEVEAAG